MVSPDRIVIELPFKAEYVSVARLTTSGIASRAGFDIETVEDIKVAVSEVCNRIIRVGSELDGKYKISFDIYDNELVIIFESDSELIKCIFDDEDGLGMSIIDAFMDKVEFCPDNDYILSMVKTIGVNSNNEL
jgi:serine/threonine-protein kinase RsbW